MKTGIFRNNYTVLAIFKIEVFIYQQLLKENSEYNLVRPQRTMAWRLPKNDFYRNQK